MRLDILNHFDVFGKNIRLRFNGLDNHRTVFGGLLSILIHAAVVVQIVSIFLELINKTAPDVIFNQQYVNGVDVFKFNEETFSFALGMEDSSFHHFVNESVYTIEATQITSQRNKTTNQMDYKLLDFGLQACKESSFKIPQVRDYFLRQPYTNLYCPERVAKSKDSDNNTIETPLEFGGDFDLEYFAMLSFKIFRCKGPQCVDFNDQAIFDQYYRNPKFAVYFNDLLTDPKVRDSPFNQIGRDLYFLSSYKMQKEITVFMIKNIVSSQGGLLFEEGSSQSKVGFSQYQEQSLLESEEDLMFTLNIRLEKKKENHWSRNYLTLSKGISQIGGIYQALMALGCFICFPFSQFQLNRKLMNEIFSFESSNHMKFEESPQIKKTQTNELSSLNHLPKGEIESNPSQIVNRDIKSFISNSFLPSFFQPPPQLGDASVSSKVTKQKTDVTTSQQKKERKSLLIPNQMNLNSFNDTTAPNNIQIVQANLSVQQDSVVSKPFDEISEGFQIRSSIPNKREINTEENNPLQQPAFFSSGSRLQSPGVYQQQLISIPIPASTPTPTQTPFIKFPGDLDEDLAKQIPVTPWKRQSVAFADVIDLSKSPKKITKKFKMQLKNMNRQFQSFFKVTAGRIKLGFLEYLRYFIFPPQQLKEKKEQMKFGMEKLYHHLDIVYILKKLTEIDKLKILLLNESQIKLFEYLPRPKISVSNPENKEQSDEVDEKVQTFNFLYQDKRTELERARDAYESFKEITRNGYIQTRQDKKLLSMVDPNLFEFFQNQMRDTVFNFDIYEKKKDTEFGQTEQSQQNELKTKNLHKKRFSLRYRDSLEACQIEPDTIFVQQLGFQQNQLKQKEKEKAEEIKSLQENSSIQSDESDSSPTIETKTLPTQQFQKKSFQTTSTSQN